MFTGLSADKRYLITHVDIHVDIHVDVHCFTYLDWQENRFLIVKSNAECKRLQSIFALSHVRVLGLSMFPGTLSLIKF